MKSKYPKVSLAALALLAAVLGTTQPAHAHCDSLDDPVSETAAAHPHKE